MTDFPGAVAATGLTSQMRKTARAAAEHDPALGAKELPPGFVAGEVVGVAMPGGFAMVHLRYPRPPRSTACCRTHDQATSACRRPSWHWPPPGEAA